MNKIKELLEDLLKLLNAQLLIHSFILENSLHNI